MADEIINLKERRKEQEDKFRLLSDAVFFGMLKRGESLYLRENPCDHSFEYKRLKNDLERFSTRALTRQEYRYWSTRVRKLERDYGI